MDCLCPVEIKEGLKEVELYVHDLRIPLDEDNALLLLSWLEQSLTCSVLFLLKIECSDFEIEGRNYDNHLDFLVLSESIDGLRALTFTMKKKHVLEIVDSLRVAVEATFKKTIADGM